MNRMHSYLSMVASVVLAGGSLFGSTYLLEDFSKEPTPWKGVNGGKAVREIVDGNPALKITLPGYVNGVQKVGIIKMGDTSVTGISFRIRGDGGDYWVPVVLKSKGGWNWRYTGLAHVTGKDWQTVTLHWSDFTPVEGAMEADIGKLGTMPVWAFDRVDFGDRWRITHCNRRIKPYTFWVDDIRFIDSKAPVLGPLPPAGKLADAVRKMRTGQPVLIACSGDSITAGTCVREADKNRYGSLLQVMLRKAFKNDRITVRTIAVGGAHSFDLRVWAKKDLAPGIPDLMTLLIGYNDKSAALSAEAYRYSVEDYLDKVQRISQGKTAFLLFPTIPGSGYRYGTQEDYAQAIRKIAAKRSLDTFDLDRMLQSMTPAKRNALYADTAHPNNDGHRLIAEKLTEYLLNYGK